MRFVEAHTKLVHKLLVLQVLLEDDEGHGIGHRAVAARLDGDPFVGERQSGFAVAGVNDHDANARLLCLGEVIVAERSDDAFRRIVAPQDDEFGVHDVRGVVVRALGTVNVRRNVVCLGAAVGVIVLQVAAVEAQQALHQMVRPRHGADAGGIDHVPAAGTVLLAAFLDLICDLLRRFLVGNTLIFAAASRFPSLHGIAESVRRKERVPVSSASGTGPQLYAVDGRIGGDIQHAAFRAPDLELAVAAAVVDPGRAHDMRLLDGKRRFLAPLPAVEFVAADLGHQRLGLQADQRFQCFTDETQFL